MNIKQIAKDILAQSEELKKGRNQLQSTNKKLCDHIVKQLADISNQVKNLDCEPDEKEGDGSVTFAKAVPITKNPYQPIGGG